MTSPGTISMNEDGKMRTGLFNNFNNNVPTSRQKTKPATVKFRAIFHICSAANGNV